MSFVLRRIIPEDKCPGTCCKKTGLVPGRDGICVHFDPSLGNRRFGGCSLMKADGTADVTRLTVLTKEHEKMFKGSTCVGFPVPDVVPKLDTPYPTKFGRGFAPACECFEWEEVR